jgi:hypothetical protein
VNMPRGQAKWYGKLHNRSAERRLAEAGQHDGYLASLLESIALLEREVAGRYLTYAEDAKTEVINDRVTVQLHCTCAWRPTGDQETVEIIQVDPTCELHGVRR